jgi:hypothetical protein
MLQVVLLRSHAEFVGLNTATSSSVLRQFCTVALMEQSHSWQQTVIQLVTVSRHFVKTWGFLPVYILSSLNPILFLWNPVCILTHVFCLRLLVMLSSYLVLITTYIVTRVQAGRSVSGRDKGIILSLTVHTGPGVHPTLHSVVIRGYVRGCKAADVWIRPLILPSAGSKNDWIFISTLPYPSM